MNLVVQINSLIILFLFLIISDLYYSRMIYKKLEFKTEKVLLYILLAILEFILEYKGNFIIKQIINIFMYFVPLFFYKISTKDKLYYFMANFISLTLVDYITSFISNSILFFIDNNLVQTINLMESIYTYIALSYIVIFIYFIIININKYVTLINKLKLLLKNNFKTTIIILLWILIIYFIITMDFIQTQNYSIKILLLIIILVVSTIIIDMIICYSKYKKYKEYSDNLLSNMEGNKSNINNYRIEKHNINNFLLGLKSSNKKELNERIDNYINSNKVKHNNFNIPYTLSGFITNKMNQYKCNFYINGGDNLKDIETTNPRLYNELCEALGIVIDNAYEAIKNYRNKEILFDITKKEKHTIISISNKFDNDINVNEIGNLFYTTKEDGNGIGLFSINKSKYLKYKIKIINNQFIISIII